MISREELVKDKERYDTEKPVEEGKKRVSQGEKYCYGSITFDKDASSSIFDLLSSNEPVMIGRFGGNELRAMMEGLVCKFPIHFVEKWKREREFRTFFEGAGFFPRNVNLLPRYSEVMVEACSQADLLGVWFNRYEDYVIEHFCKEDVKFCNLGMLEPYSDMLSPWSRALKRKKVLVVHPFSQSIEKQYAKRAKLFENCDVLPEFELKTFKAVQTAAGAKDRRFRDWFEALDYMYREIHKIDYDIAILGCGAYGFPLAAKIKQDGKKAVHLGGATQIMFGIRGKRWDNNPYTKALYNEYWEYPLKNETPLGISGVEGGTYWRP